MTVKIIMKLGDFGASLSIVDGRMTEDKQGIRKLEQRCADTCHIASVIKVVWNWHKISGIELIVHK